MNKRTTAQTLLLVLGALLLIGGLVCVVVGFASFVGSDPEDGGSSGFAPFGGGGIAAVIGLGIIGFTRVSMVRANGGYARVVIEQGYGAQQVPQTSAAGGGRFCFSCGQPVGPAAKFCDSCGAAL